MSSAPLRLLVALPAEARPLAERFGLRRDPEVTDFPIFRAADGNDVALVVSGPGKLAAAAAVAYLHLATGGERDAAWLDVGIAGHRERAVGEAVIAHRVRDRASGESWYPPQLLSPRLPAESVLTVDTVERVYPGDWVYDMEASGFCAAAARFASAELVQVLKVVSDNRAAPIAGERLDKERITALIDARLDPIEWLADELRTLAAALREQRAMPRDYRQLLAAMRFTVSERRALEHLLRRRQALAPETPLPGDLAHGCRRGKELNQRLALWLDRLPVRL